MCENIGADNYGRFEKPPDTRRKSQSPARILIKKKKEETKKRPSFFFKRVAYTRRYADALASFWAMGSPGKLTHLEIKVPILRVHIMTFLFYPVALAENRLDKYRNNDREKYAVNRSDLWNIIIKAIERIPARFQYIFLINLYCNDIQNIFIANLKSLN